ncbi:S1/P1 nuclease [Dyella flava]|uniref:S1/P1 nuclease n=1 Tax=Dyella flava TaxID=1920170 RepID=A0ABS2K6A4_9GAMM|nr:S1/P1 nuclease [Dyella flava]MBM7126735.1 S1/P1 nuclease [Dyella flava]GLQ49442.1 endonuclease [Dyella flava]
MFSVRRVAAALFATLAIAPAAQAWGPLGHSVVAELAQRHLSPAAKAEVAHLLALDHTTSLADIASWPDEIRDDPKQQDLWKQTRALHYIDFQGDCHYTPPRDCKNGQCVVEAIPHYLAILGDRSQSDEARLQALKFVVHFVGDIHQPLHANYQEDAGGNKYQVQFQGQGTNLHRVWDSGLLSTRKMDWKSYADMLDGEGAVPLPPSIAPYDNAAVLWAEESCQITRNIYPANHKIDQAYIDAELPVADTRLREAGRRLAEVLNLALQNG